MDHARDPCPYVILNDFGGAFAMGVCLFFFLLFFFLLFFFLLFFFLLFLSCLLRVFLPIVLALTSQAIGGTIWHGIKGYRNSPYGERRIGALTAIKMRAPVLGGNFGVWGGLFSTFDCAIKGIRKKEDPYNAIIAGFFTGGSLAVRGGYKAARNGAIGCAVLLAVIEGVGIAMQKMMAGSTKLETPLPPQEAVAA